MISGIKPGDGFMEIWIINDNEWIRLPAGVKRYRQDQMIQ
jgi:hypothetical protein